MKIEGQIVPLEREFVVNLAEGRYGKVSVAVVVEQDSTGSEAEAPEETGLHQEPVIRAIITDFLTGLRSEQLLERNPREALLEEIAATIEKTTDEKVQSVYFTDLAVQ